ncbi:MAG: c-type cytochrome [Alphaproteobacteria bacterium]|nr:c-type cytochrome [Alphaproteobacteria bacterium]
MMRLAVPISVAVLFLSVPAAAQDIADGQILFNQRCSFCHSLTRQSQKTMYVPLKNPSDMLNDPVDPGSKPPAVGQKTTISALRQGPDLSGLLNRAPGGMPNYAYGQDYSAYGDEWNEQSLDAWIIKHDDGRTDADARVHIIAYLSTLRSQ